jgi:hypothetical protein
LNLKDLRGDIPQAQSPKASEETFVYLANDAITLADSELMSATCRLG